MFNLIREITILLNYWQLILKLASKEIKVRYKHPVLGFLWALIVPLSIILVFKVVFSLIIKVPITEGYPFFIFLATAVFPWNFFSQSLSGSTTSIQDNGNLIKKVYFPREIIPISIILANLINFLLTLIVILPMFIFFKVRLSNLIIFLPLVVLLQIVFTTGISLVFSGLQARFRDIKFIVEIMLLVWFYLTPVFYSLDLVSSISIKFFNIYMLNPLTQIVTLYRITLLDGYINSLPSNINIFYLISLSVVSSFGLLFLGFWIFKKLEPRFADLV